MKRMLRGQVIKKFISCSCAVIRSPKQDHTLRRPRFCTSLKTASIVW